MTTSKIGMTARSATTRSLNNWLNQSWRILTLPLLLFLALPLVAIFTQARLPDLWATLNQQQVIQAVSLSLATSLSTALLTLLMGTPVAYILAQRRSGLNRFADTLIDLPTVLPPSVAGVALLMAFGRRGLLGPWLELAGINIPFTLVAVIMAQSFVAAPYYVKAAAIGFAGIDPELKQAAALDGADRLQIFRYIVLPMTWMALLSGSVMTWARALGEFGATIIFAGNLPGRTQTMPLAIYIGFEIELKTALTLSIVLICFSFASLMIVKWVLHHRLEADLEAGSR